MWCWCRVRSRRFSPSFRRYAALWCISCCRICRFCANRWILSMLLLLGEYLPYLNMPLSPRIHFQSRRAYPKVGLSGMCRPTYPDLGRLLYTFQSPIGRWHLFHCEPRYAARIYWHIGIDSSQTLIPWISSRHRKTCFLLRHTLLLEDCFPTFIVTAAATTRYTRAHGKHHG